MRFLELMLRLLFCRFASFKCNEYLQNISLSADIVSRDELSNTEKGKFYKTVVN